MRSNRLAGHELWKSGVYPVREGVGVCSCGEKSELLPSANARKKWHRNHKNEVRSEHDQASGVTRPKVSGASDA